MWILFFFRRDINWKTTKVELNKTPKPWYWQQIRSWIKIVSVAAQANAWRNAVFKSAGIRILLSCDHLAQDLLRQAQSQGKFLLQGDDEHDPEKRALIEQILNVIASETPTEQIRREVDLPTDTYDCKWKPLENPSSFANRFSAAVARYSFECSNLNPAVDRYFAVMILRNANLSDDTLNAPILISRLAWLRIHNKNPFRLWSMNWNCCWKLPMHVHRQRSYCRRTLRSVCKV